MAISQAESLLDEFLAKRTVGNSPTEESTGELPRSRLPGIQPKTYRITSTPYQFGNANSNRTGETANPSAGSLLRVTVEVFETSGSTLSGEAQPLVELTRLIRQPQPALTAAATETRGVASSNAFGTDTNPFSQGALP